MQKSKVTYYKKSPLRSVFPANSLVIYDKKLLQMRPFKDWLKQFPQKIGVQSGENLKSLKSLEAILIQIEKVKGAHATDLHFIALGGGSVGDFVGFLASIYKRGRPLINVPTTWLAAVDSSHGGKTALNTQKTKNQIGTFWPALKVVICEEFLKTQPPEREKEALAEILKIALISSAPLFKKVSIKIEKQQPLWNLVNEAIQLKYKIVYSDPFEKKGHRRLLNLGHTMGHVFESVYHVPHGQAVAAGLVFSTLFSHQRRLLTSKDFTEILGLLHSIIDLEQYFLWLKKLSLSKAVKKLSQDKKNVGQNKIDFIFIKKTGRAIRLKISINEIISEIKRQKKFRYV